MRHLREVHGQQSQGQTPQTFKCPEPNCKRHHRGFAREYNMLEHHRRLHGENAEQITIVQSGHADSISSARPEGDDTGLGTTDNFDSVYLQGRSSNETALQVLRTELNELKAQKEQALQNFDQKIVAMSTALRFMEERLQNTMAVE